MVELGSDGVLAPGRWRWARALGWMVATLAAITIVAVLLGSSLIGLVPLLPPKLEPFGGFVAVAISAALVVATYAVLVRQGERRDPSELSTQGLWRELAVGVFVGAALMELTVGVMWAAGWVTLGSQPVTAIWTALGATVQSGVVEEVAFRLIILRLVWRAAGLPVALVVSALLFGGLHLANLNASLFAAVCIAAEAGLLLGAAYVLTGRLWMAAGLHAGWNFTQGWVLGAPVSGSDAFYGGPLVTLPVPGVATVLNGGGFGPEASLPALVLCTAAGVYLLHRASRHPLIRADVSSPAVPSP